jgi:uncharacterized protein with LGFP repeats
VAGRRRPQAAAPALRRPGRRRLRPPHRLAQRLRLRRRAPHPPRPLHWDDIGYNFVVDRCGTVYEGRAGGVERAVTGAHTQGFNHGTTGIAALGTFTAGMPVPRPMIRAIAALSAWKLGLTGTDPRARVRLVSSNGLSRYAAGTTAELPALAGHNDGYMTSCPGAALHARLPEIRRLAARLQGRPAGPQERHSRRAASSDPGALPSAPQPADRRWGS